MKKLITVIATLAVVAVSCNKENNFDKNIDGGGDSTPGLLTATFEQAKVSYAEDGDNLQPAWEVDDAIVGFDDAGDTYTFTVTKVQATTATLSADKAIADGKYYLIFKSGAQASDITDKSLAIDYTAQAGDKTMPAVMLAEGTVENGGCNFSFRNAGAIIGISAVKGVPQGSKVTKITVSGENLSAAGIALSGGALALTATPRTDDAISVDGLELTVTDEDGTLSSPIFIAVPVGAQIAKVGADLQARAPETMKIPSLAADKKNIDYVEIEAQYDGTNLSTKKWAKWNVGANSQSDYGWYFFWAGTEGYVYKNSNWLSARGGVDTYYYTLSSVKTAVAGDYLYVKTQSFMTPGFTWEHTPYHTGSDSFTGWTKYVHTSQPSYWSGTGDPDGKLVLDDVDDAAIVNWGATWRTPILTEFNALKNATFWALDKTDEGWYVFQADGTHKAGTVKTSVPKDLNKADCLLFFPISGYGIANSLMSGGYGIYMSSTLSKTTSVYRLSIDNVGYVQTNYGNRFYGSSVRPISD